MQPCVESDVFITDLSAPFTTLLTFPPSLPFWCCSSFLRVFPPSSAVFSFPCICFSILHSLCFLLCLFPSTSLASLYSSFPSFHLLPSSSSFTHISSLFLPSLRFLLHPLPFPLTRYPPVPQVLPFLVFAFFPLCSFPSFSSFLPSATHVHILRAFSSPPPPCC